MNVATAQKSKKRHTKSIETTQGSTGQTNHPITGPGTAKGVNLNIYNMAMSNMDFQVAVNALYNLIAENPETPAYKDSLASLYFVMQRYGSCIKVCNDILSDGPPQAPNMLELSSSADSTKTSGETAGKGFSGNIKILGLLALSEKAIGRSIEALAAYEKLFVCTQDLQYAYEIAALQFNIQRFGECRATIEAIIATITAENQQTIQIVYQANENQPGVNPEGRSSLRAQDVPLKAAAYNLKGVLQLELNEIEEAQASFNKALELFPDFQLTIGNLESLTVAK